MFGFLIQIFECMHVIPLRAATLIRPNKKMASDAFLLRVRKLRDLLLQFPGQSRQRADMAPTAFSKVDALVAAQTYHVDLNFFG